MSVSVETTYARKPVPSILLEGKRRDDSVADVNIAVINPQSKALITIKYLAFRKSFSAKRMLFNIVNHPFSDHFVVDEIGDVHDPQAQQRVEQYNQKKIGCRDCGYDQCLLKPEIDKQYHGEGKANMAKKRGCQMQENTRLLAAKYAA